MTNSTKISPLWDTLPANMEVMAKKAGAKIVVCDKTYGLICGGDLISDSLTLDHLDNFLQGLIVGQDRFDVPALVDELAKAEQIIQTLTANMSDGQRTKAAHSLEAVGFPVRHATRCKERQEFISEVRGILGESAA
ncbi:hypothetical protein AAKU55_003171 [Oxalobacteraceae bacterium GrIS 1.11]